MSTSTALTVKRSSQDAALMPPPPPVKRLKRPPKVLDEETYTSALSHIIARDFFPGLLETETQQDFLNALDAGDNEWINEAERRVREIMTPREGPKRTVRRGISMTPRFGNVSSALGALDTPRSFRGDTPLSSFRTPRTSAGDIVKKDEEEVDLNLSLSAFQAKYTSEDNESFDKIVDTQNAKRAEKYAWMWSGNKLPSARQIAQAVQQQKLLAAAATSSGTAKSQALMLRPSQDQDSRPAMIDPRPSTGPRNGFMFTPEDMSDRHPQLKSVAQTAADSSNAPPKSVSYGSTRLPLSRSSDDDEADASSTVPESPSLSAIDDAIHGHPRPRYGMGTGANSIVISSDKSQLDNGDETPHVNGYSFVDAEPTPSELGIPPTPPRAAAALSTLSSSTHPLLAELISSSGSHGSSNPLLGKDSGGGAKNPFQIAEPRKREALHHRIVEKQLQSKRTSSAASAAGTPISTPRFYSSPRFTARSSAGTGAGAGARTPSTPSAKAGRGALTPAARQLYNKLDLSSTPSRSASSKSIGAGIGAEARPGGGIEESSRGFDNFGSSTPTSTKKDRDREKSGTPLRVRRAA